MRSSLKFVSLLTLVIAASAFQIIKTSLTITVRDETGNTVGGASVQLFEKEEDYKAETNIVAQGVTDDKGALKLKELKPASYFVIVTKGDKDNSDGGERTARLEEKRMNKVTIIIQ
ncbi:MAG: carboxypeptidase-like regulatory domain-containing protein [Chryseolinea sp.]